MDLLPKTTADFSSEEYWNEFFIKRKDQRFEWYGDYVVLYQVLDKYIQRKDRVLVIGCGNSRLSADLYETGVCNITNIDIDYFVVKQMKDAYRKTCPEMVYEKMDVLEMTYTDETFTVVLDKGTLDALLVDTTEATDLKISKMFCEIERVLRFGGRYICISLLQEHVLKKTLTWFLDRGWLVRIHRCAEADAKHQNALSFPVFVIILTKIKKTPDSSMILEIIDAGNMKPKRCSIVKDAVNFVQYAQYYAFLKHHLGRKKVVGDDICLELCCPKSSKVKYLAYVVDREETSALQFAIFIVPQGRETEWLFGTPEGRRDLASKTDAERLIVVHLLRGNTYKDLAEVKKDLSYNIMELAPITCRGQVPILSIGDDIGTREVMYSDKTEANGNYIIEDVVMDDGQKFRRLIFLKNPYLIQSEAKLITVYRKKKKGPCMKKTEIDFDFLACDHHALMVSCISFLDSRLLNPKILVVGLGGGGLIMYLFKHFQDATIDVVELDKDMLEIAKKWFGFATDDRIRIIIDDGINYFKEAVSKGIQYDAVMLDVDNKNTKCGMSSPPLSFLETGVLKDLSHAIPEDGIVALNLACRNADLHAETYGKLKGVFKHVFSAKIPNEINEVVCCTNRDSDDLLSPAKAQSVELTSYLKESSKHQLDINITELVSSLQMLS